MNPEASIGAFDTACRILIVGGLIQLIWGLISGLPMGSIRLRLPEVPKYLTLSHVGGFMQAPLLLGLVFAVQLSTLPAGWETLAALSVTGASLLLAFKDALNWAMGVRDEFAEKSIGFYLGGVLVPLYFLGTAIIVAGVLKSLFA